MSFTPEEADAFRLAASSFLAIQEQMELVAQMGSISNAMRAAHFEKSGAVIGPVVSCYRRTGKFPVLRFRGWIFKVGPADLAGEVIDLVAIRESSIEDV